MSRVVCAFVVAVVLNGAATATPLSLVVQPHGDAAAGATFAVTFARVDTPAQTIVRSAEAAEPLLLELEPGHWSVDVSADGWWHRTQFVTVGDEKVAAVAEVWRRAEVIGTVRTLPGVALPSDVTARFATAADDGVPDGDVTCPLVDGRFRCALPAVAMDLRIRAKGFIAHYFWQKKLRADSVEDVGSLAFRAGASIVGWTSAPRARVRASQAANTGLREINTTADSRGFFHVDGVAPGAWSMTARAGKRLSSRPVDVVVYPGSEIEIKEPLRLTEPFAVTVTVNPARDPWDEPWRVTVERELSRDEVETVASGTAVGQWTSPPLHAGSYRIDVAPSRGGRWATRGIVVDEAPVSVALDAPSRAVAGHVFLGDAPLAATVTFAAADLPLAIAVESDDEGAFAGYLPVTEAAVWDAEVRSAKPPVKGTVHALSVEGARAQRLELRIPKTTISGRVVDEEKNAVASAFVNIIASGRAETFTQAMTLEDGTFAIHGLPPGRYEASAAAFLQQSDVVELVVGDDGTSSPLHLVTRKEVKVGGVVTSPLSTVPGAQVTVWPTDRDVPFVSPRRTNGRGEFRTTVPAGTREIDVFVAAPGFAFKAFHTRVERQVLLVSVAQNGGTIAINAPRMPGSTTWLLRSGAMIAMPALATSWFVTERGDATVAMQMEPGAYSACVIRDAELRAFRSGAIPEKERCVNGYLAPGGSLDLDLARVAARLAK